MVSDQHHLYMWPTSSALSAVMKCCSLWRIFTYSTPFAFRLLIQTWDNCLDGSWNVSFSRTVFHHHLLNFSVTNLICLIQFWQVNALLRYVHLQLRCHESRKRLSLHVSFDYLNLPLWKYYLLLLCVCLNNYVCSLTNNIALICFIFWFLFVIRQTIINQ